MYFVISLVGIYSVWKVRSTRCTDGVFPVSIVIVAGWGYIHNTRLHR